MHSSKAPITKIITFALNKKNASKYEKKSFINFRFNDCAIYCQGANQRCGM